MNGTGTESGAVRIRQLRNDETALLEEFVYEAIFIPAGMEKPSREIIRLPELRLYYENFGSGKADYCFAAEVNQTVIGAAWSRIMNDYGHVDDETPSLAIALYEDYRGKGIGTCLMRKLLELLKEKGFKHASLSVQKENYAVNMYRNLGFETIRETDEEFIMICEL